MATLLQGNNFEPSSFFTTSVSCQTEKTEENVKTRECVKKIIEMLNHEMDSVLLSKEPSLLPEIKNLEDKTVLAVSQIVKFGFVNVESA